MPPARRVSLSKITKQLRNDSHTKSKLLIVTNGKRRVLVSRPATHQDAIAVARRHFPHLRKADIALRTDELSVCEGEYVEIAPDAWAHVLEELSSVLVSEIQYQGEPPAGVKDDEEEADRFEAQGW
ncbi:hypothetical protein PLICRDRAFT_699312 [Plicaturopsis crispa FD-325 SS-3]|nr:hypothetical protein PLICRDRAFT_699312 [Plicaturopsis crispa FD-325 SS-3]